MILVIKNGTVLAIHDDYQLSMISDGRYGDSEITMWDGSCPNIDPDNPPPADPRPVEQREKYAALTVLKLSEQNGEMIRVIEDLAAAVQGLGGTLPSSALDKIAARKEQRQKL